MSVLSAVIIPDPDGGMFPKIQKQVQYLKVRR